MKNRELKFRAWTKDHWINKGMVYDWQNMTYIESVGFAPEEIPVMQYIGLKDKNGEEIYEGDIVQREEENCDNIKYNATYFVEYKQNECSFCLKTIQSKVFKKDAVCYLSKNVEIIGNLYENPELTETK